MTDRVAIRLLVLVAVFAVIFLSERPDYGDWAVIDCNQFMVAPFR